VPSKGVPSKGVPGKGSPRKGEPGKGVPSKAGPAAPKAPAAPEAVVGPEAAVGPAGPPAGPELARAVLDAAKVQRAGRPAVRRSTMRGGRRLRGYSGPGPDPRDPQPFGAVLGQLMKARGWQRPAAEARLFGDWVAVVGEEIASHCRPVKLENGELTIEAESTAWATQLRLLGNRLLRRVTGDVGGDLVKRLSIHGPVAPSWAKGPKRVRGRGPRDTYG
jgi:predicted nucleic acid-binding Zn ribbon protein